MFTKEMQKALEADGEKLRQLTGEDHGPFATRMAIDAIRDEAFEQCATLLRTRALQRDDQDIANALTRIADEIDEFKSANGGLP